MKLSISYGLIKSGEVNEACNLIMRIFNTFVAPEYTKEGIDTFSSMLSPDFLSGQTKELFSIVARCNERLIGLISFVKASHLALLFVEEYFQGKGVGEKLIKEGTKMCRALNPDLKTITVSSSPNSLGFYKHFGFRVISEEIDEKGMRFTPMELNIQSY